MSKKLTTDDVRDLFVKRWWEGGGRPTEYGPKFDEWLHFVRKEAHDEGYELCWADVQEDRRESERKMGQNE